MGTRGIDPRLGESALGRDLDKQMVEVRHRRRLGVPDAADRHYHRRDACLYARVLEQPAKQERLLEPGCAGPSENLRDRPHPLETSPTLKVGVLRYEIRGALQNGDRVALTPFGNFVVRQRKAREGRNPKTGATIKIPARRVPAFVAGRALKEAITGSGAAKKGGRKR